MAGCNWRLITVFVLLLLALLGAGALAAKPSVDVPSVSVITSEKGKTLSEFSLTYGSKFGETISLKAKNAMTMSFQVKDAKSAGRMRPHQVFLRLFCAATDEEFILVPSFKNDEFTVVIDLHKHAQSVFDFKSGVYTVELIIGDPDINVPMLWNMGSVSLDFSDHPATPVTTSASSIERKLWAPQPEIKHIFRAPEKRASRFMSRIFTLFVLCPWVFLVMGLIHVKANISGLFSTGSDFIFSVAFQVCILALIGVLALYWLSINIFQALAWLSIIGVATFVVGTRALRGTVIAQKEKSD